jgi:DNA-directed RNA polymerase specialized sigma24 family protein
VSRLRGDEATLYERYARPLERSVARALGADREHADDACAFAWAQLCATQPERHEHLVAWLRTTAIREGWRLAQLARRESAPTPAGDEDDTEAAWEERLAAAETLEHALDGRAAVEVLTSLRRREARYLALLAAGYSYREIAEREGVTYTNVILSRDVVDAAVRKRQETI